MKTLLKIKDKNLYQACRICYGECEHYRYNYIGETVQNTVTRWSEHNNPDHKSDPTEHIKKKYEDFMPSSFKETSQEELRSNFYCIIQTITKRSKIV